MASRLAQLLGSAITYWTAEDLSPPEALLAAYPPNAIEVHAPLYTNAQTPPVCTTTIMNHTFGYSYGSPYVGNFTAPACATSDSIVYLKWMASVSKGRQYDRIAAAWINGVELLRTSTQEPWAAAGVTWEVAKDVTNYQQVFRDGGTVVVSLDNVVNDVYTSVFTIQLVLEYYTPAPGSTGETQLAHLPDIVTPVSKSWTTYGWFRVEPNSVGTNFAQVSVPPNTEELYLEMFLSHHQCDEFYFTNPPSDYANPMYNCRNGPFREVQVLVDNEVVGVVWPFPLVFTGGMCRYLWRPIVGTGAFEAPTYLINLTPFLGKFVDGKSHNVTYAVDHGIDIWPMDGNLLVYLDKTGTQTISKVIAKQLEPHVEPQVGREEHGGFNATFFTSASREIRIEAQVTTSKGTKLYKIHQQFQFENTQIFTEDGIREDFEQLLTVVSNEHVYALGKSSPPPHQQMHRKLLSQLAKREEYPIKGSTKFQIYDDITKAYRLQAQIDHDFRRSLHVRHTDRLRVFLDPSEIAIHQTGKGFTDSKVGGNGTMSVDLISKKPSGCYSRHVDAQDGTTTSSLIAGMRTSFQATMTMTMTTTVELNSEQDPHCFMGQPTTHSQLI